MQMTHCFQLLAHVQAYTLVLCKLTNQTFIQILQPAIKRGWTLTGGEWFETFPEGDNTSDRHAVAVTKLNSYEVVGRLLENFVLSYDIS